MTPRPSRLAGVVFGLLVASTFAAFFVAQRLKHDPSPVQGFRQDRVFSPNGDGRLDVEHIDFKLTRTDEVTIEVLDGRGDTVRKLVDGVRMRAYRRMHFRWDGRIAGGHRAPDGRYRLRITLRREGRSLVRPNSFVLDTTPPRVQVVSVGPKPSRPAGHPAPPLPKLLPSAGGAPAHVRFSGPARQSTATVFQTGPGPIARVYGPVAIPDGVRMWDWAGNTQSHGPATPGSYVVVIASRDVAGNVGTSVPLDPRTGLPQTTYGVAFPGRGGITVRRLGVLPPYLPTPAGQVGDVAVDSRTTAYAWALRRVGDPTTPVRGGIRDKPFLHLHAPPGPSRLFLLTVQANGAQQRVPYPVQAQQRVAGPDATHPQGVLVVLPAITWQGRNPVDDDGDGLPNLLDRGLPVPLARVFSGDGLPAGFSANEGPLMAFLDRRHHRFDLTTDAALAGAGAPDLRRYHGVLIAGNARWLPVGVERALRAFASGGGTVVSLGTDSLRREVTLTRGGRLIDPTPPSATDLFGTRLGPLVPTGGTPVENVLDKLGLFVGGTGGFAGYDRYEPTLAVQAGARELARAVDGKGATVIVASTFGRGLVIRTGLVGFAAHLGHDNNAAALMESMWRRLSR